MFCKQCGNEIKEGAVFCTNCGAKQTVDAPAQNAGADSEKTIGIFAEMPKTQPEAPVVKAEPVVAQAPVQEPVYQAPVQQPVQPTYQAPVQPVYQAPVQPENNYASAGTANSGSVSFFEAIKLFFINYANFNGRATRSEYWWAFLFNYLASFILVLIPVIGSVLALGLLIPGLSICIRRLHDIGKAWYNIFFGLIPLAGFIILIVFYCRESDGDNQWGPRR